MSPKKFISGLVMTVLIQIGCCLLLFWWLVPVRAHVGFIIMSILVMILFCIVIYAAARRITKSAMKGLFIQLIIISVFFKMVLCLGLIIGYKKGFDPQDNSFLWPFLIIYLATSIFEVIFLEQVGRPKKNQLV